MKTGENKTLIFKGECYENSKEKFILEISIGNKLTFDKHVKKQVNK